MTTKIFYLYDRFFVSNRTFTTEHVKILGFSRFFVQNSGFFAKFLKFQVKWKPLLQPELLLKKNSFFISSFPVIVHKPLC